MGNNKKPPYVISRRWYLFYLFSKCRPSKAVYQYDTIQSLPNQHPFGRVVGNHCTIKKNMPTSLTRGFISNQFHPTPYARLGRQIGHQRRRVRRLVTSRTTKYKSTDTGFSYTSHPALSQSRTSEPEGQLTALEDRCTQRDLRNVVQSDNSTVDGHQEAGSHVYSVLGRKRENHSRARFKSFHFCLSPSCSPLSCKSDVSTSPSPENNILNSPQHTSSSSPQALFPSRPFALPCDGSDSVLQCCVA